ncbi:type I-E CRISPR-associated protein Cas7/Cse4/CasC [Mycobacterium hubeiense]|uniref:type I-E CRISPR-associated protein Cas7/Cse4/CasC n=1 Tax=Mycobacterium hubeiense TaxID=1867256 RepID=UPI000C7EF271|nr:type I-E CRISPR-associated protein Cas7/Cse4/CasC [Mycobacterium sp. QGD 101]
MTTAATTVAPFVTLHALQAFPPSLLNRDDSNTAKQIVIGDTLRVRVSAQSAKRAIRQSMRAHRLAGHEYGLRTSRFPALTAAVLVEEFGRPADVAAAKTAAVFRKLNLKATNKGDTAVLVFGREALPSTLAAVIDKAWEQIGDEVPADTLTAARTALDPGRALDVALFGRMLAEIPGGRIDGAVGVSHSFSVDAAAIEPDWWTAVDDAAVAGEPVSANLGESMVSAPILYRTASLDRRLLRTNLQAAGGADTDELAIAAERSFIEWFIRAVPSAKQRSSVAATLPSVVIAVAGPQPLSAANAFATPVAQPDVMATATTRLVATLDRAKAVIGDGHDVYLSADPAVDAVLEGKAPTTSIAAFLDAIAAR